MITSMQDLVKCLRRFHEGLMSTPGLPESAVPDDLPDPLRLLYRELGALVALTSLSDGHRGGPFQGQDSLVPVDALKRVDGMVEFAWENQGNWSCRSPLGPGDPAVFSDAAAYWEEPREGFVAVCDSLEHFLTTLSLQEAVMSAPYVWQVSHSGELKDAFVASIDALWLNGLYVHGEPSHSFFEAPGYDAIVMEMEYAGIWVGGHSAASGGLIKAGIACDRIR